MQVAEQGKTRLDGIFRKLITVGSTYSRDCTELEGGGRQAISCSDWLASAEKPVDSRPQLVHCKKLDHCGASLESRFETQGPVKVIIINFPFVRREWVQRNSL